MPGSGLGKAAAPLPASENHRHNANSPFWYSFDYGSVHFTTVSTEHDLTRGSEQRKVSLLLSRLNSTAASTLHPT